MKRILLAMALVFGLSQPAHALIGSSKISDIIRIDSNACAVTIDTSGNLLNILPLDQLQINGGLLTTLSNLLNLNLMGDIDHILVASQSFEDIVDIHADIQIPDAVCQDFVAGSVIDLVAGGLNNLDSIELPDLFGDLTSLTLGDDGLLHLIDLNVLSIPVDNVEGDSTAVGDGNNGVGGMDTVGSQGAEDNGGNGTTIGGLPNGAAESGGCALSSDLATSSSSLLGLWTMFTVIGWNVFLRKK